MTKKSLKDVLGAKNLAPNTNTTNINNEGQLTVNLDKLREHNIFFATPCYGGLVTDQYFLSMFRITQELIRAQIKFRITTLRNESLITRARNILTAMFLDSDCSHLMFIDADIEFNPEAIIRMLAMDKAIIAGAYPKKTIDWNSVKSAAERGEKDISNFGADYAVNFKLQDPINKKLIVQDGAIEMLDVSTGFLMIKREVFEKIMMERPDLHYKNDSNIDPKLNKLCYLFFDTTVDPVSRRYLSEDYSFVRLAQSLGYKVWLDPNTNLNHVGSFTFKGNISSILTSN